MSVIVCTENNALRKCQRDEEKVTVMALEKCFISDAENKFITDGNQQMFFQMDELLLKTMAFEMLLCNQSRL